MIDNYIEYYNNKRLQRNLGVLTPFEKHEQYMLVREKLPPAFASGGRNNFYFFNCLLDGKQFQKTSPFFFFFKGVI